MSGNALADAFTNANKPTVPIQSPFEVMGQAGDVMAKINANRLFQAQQAAGAAQQNAIGPDGTYSPDRFRQNLLAAGPVAAPAAQSSLAANQALSSDQLNQARDKMGWIAKASQDALTKNDFSDAAMLKSLTQGSADGVLTMPEITKQLQTMPPDAAGRKAWLEQHQAQALSSQQHLDLHYGTRQPVNTGAGTTFPVVPPPSAGGSGPFVPNAPTPQDRNALQRTWNPVTRQFENTSRQQVAPMVDGQGNPIPGSAVPGLPSSGRPAAAGTPAPGPMNIAEPSPGTEDEMKGSASHLVAARDRANNYQANIYPVEGAITALSGADTGKGGEVLNNIRGYLGDTPLKYLGNFLPSSMSDQDKRTLYDEANKYTTGMALAAPGGSRSNAGEAAATAANPSVHISNAAALAVSKSILAQKRMEQAGTLAFNKSGQPAGTYDAFMNTWNTNQDPRAFLADRMTPPERAAVVKDLGGINSPGYQRYKQSYLAGVDAKVTDAIR
jgi:hypothetical protein